MPSEVDGANFKTYTRRDVVRRYSMYEHLFPGEQVLFAQLAPSIRDRKILDIGVGGGRTTRYLLDLSADYTAIDYSPAFVEAVKEKYGLRSVLLEDVRDMRSFAANTFDFILFSFNGIDYVDHVDRLKALGEIHRILRPGGQFLFSSHNLEWRNAGKLPWQMRPWSLNLVKRSLLALLYTPRRLRMKRFECRTDGFAILNEDEERFSLLTYYSSISNQTRQLAQKGFSNIQAYDFDGRRTLSADDQHFMIYYLASKPAP